MKLEWRPLAHADMLDIVTYIAQDDPVAAYDVHAELERQIGMLAMHPNMGRRGRIRGTRELVIAGLPYVAPYRVLAKRVEILRLLHTSRQWPARMADLENAK